MVSHGSAVSVMALGAVLAQSHLHSQPTHPPAPSISRRSVTH